MMFIELSGDVGVSLSRLTLVVVVVMVMPAGWLPALQPAIQFVLHCGCFLGTHRFLASHCGLVLATADFPKRHPTIWVVNVYFFLDCCLC